MAGLRLTERIGLLSALRSQDFRWLWTGMSVSLVGDGIFLVAVTWETYLLWDAPAAMAVVGIAMALPQAILVLLGGIVSDRVDKRVVMIAADSVRATALLALGALALNGSLQLWHVLALGAVYGAASAFFLPAFDAMVPGLVPTDALAQANALDQFVRPVAARLIGPAIGGLLVGAAGVGPAFIVDAVTFAVSSLAVAMIRKPAIVHLAGVAAPMKDLREGLRFVRSQVWLWGTFLGACVACLVFTGPADVLLPYLVKNELHGTPQLLGAVYAVGGVGAVAAAAIVGQRGLPRRHMTFTYVTWTIATLAVAGYGLAVLPWQLMIACLLFNGLETAGLVVWSTTRQTLVPARMRARVASLELGITYGIWPLSYAITIPLAAVVGIRATLVGAGLVGAVFTLAFLYLPGMRDVERQGLVRRGALVADEAAV